MKFGESIKEIRGRCLLSQSDFAKELGVSFSTINRWENGKSLPKISKLRKINDFCEKKNIPFSVQDYIFSGTKEMKR